MIYTSLNGENASFRKIAILPYLQRLSRGLLGKTRERRQTVSRVSCMSEPWRYLKYFNPFSGNGAIEHRSYSIAFLTNSMVQSLTQFPYSLNSYVAKAHANGNETNLVKPNPCVYFRFLYIYFFLTVGVPREDRFCRPSQWKLPMVLKEP